ncbi:MAG: prepilin-type N-terminal cleavage/methylation domain-containing protein [Acidobacteriota bacterium]
MSRQRGFSLIEVLVALGILAAVTLSVIGLFSQSITLNATGQDYTKINSLARDKLEELVGLPFNHADLSLLAGTTEREFPNDLYTDLPEHDRPAERTYIVRELRLSKTSDTGTPDQQLSVAVAAGAGNIKEITVIVRSGKRLFGHREIRVSTFKVDGLLQ